MVVGAHAVSFHGQLRFSADIDVVIHRPFSERDALRELLEREGFDTFTERRDPQWGQRLVAMDPSGIPVEFFFTPSNEVYDREFDRRVRAPFDGEHVWVISPEDLVLRKLVNMRMRKEMDFQDAVSVIRRQGKRFDRAYVRRHCGVYRVCAFFDQAVAQAETPDYP